MIKYTFVMPYFRRGKQFYNTLASLKFFYGRRTDWNVVVVEDSKNNDQLHAIVRLFEDDIKIRIIKTGRKDLYNPSPAYNAGVRVASGEYIVLTSPECMHVSNVLSIFDQVFESSPEAYAVAACQSGKNIEGVYDGPGTIEWDHHMWYHHTQHHDMRYHFCSALFRDTYIAIGGFDERYAEGYCFDDDSFRDRVASNGIPFALVDTAIVMHQEHDKGNVPKALWERNKALYESECFNIKV